MKAIVVGVLLFPAMGCAEHRYRHGVDDGAASCGPCALPSVCTDRGCGAATGWTMLKGSTEGGALTVHAASGSSPALALGPDGTPYVAFAEQVGAESEIWVLRYRDGRWEELDGSATGGGVSNTETPSANPSIAVGSDGSVGVAWIERLFPAQDGDGYESAGELYFRVHRDGAWRELDGSASGSGVTGASGPRVLQPNVAFTSTNVPVLAWLQQITGWDVYVRAYRDGAWTSFAGSGSGEGVSASLDTAWSANLAIDHLDRPIAAWYCPRNGQAEIILRRFDGTDWIGVGGSDGPQGLSNTPEHASLAPRVAVGPDGTLHVAYRDAMEGYFAPYAVWFDETRWAGLTAGGDDPVVGRTGRMAGNPELAVGTGGVVVAWAERHEDRDDVRVHYVGSHDLDSIGWKPLGHGEDPGGLSQNGRASAPRVAIDEAGRVTVAWLESAETGGRIVARRYQ